MDFIEVCYGFHPLMSIDLINQLKSLNEIGHEQQQIENHTMLKIWLMRLTNKHERC